MPRCLIVISLALLGSGLSDASTLFEQLPGPGSSNITQTGAASGNRVADNFQLASGGTVRTVEWWGWLNLFAPGQGVGGSDYQITFYADAGGSPGSPLSTMSVNPATFLTSVPAPVPITLYSAILRTPFSATPGTPYWVSVFDAAPGEAFWWISANVNTDFGSIMQSGSSTWDPNTDRNFVLDRAFGLTDDVPEPSTFTLLAIAILGLGYFRPKGLQGNG